jgi:hypothetical protein
VNKYESLRHLYLHGFNVSPFMHYDSFMESCIRDYFIFHRVKVFGVRCYKPYREEPHAPFKHSIQGLDHAFGFADSCTHAGWDAIICESYPLEWVKLNCELMSDGVKFVALTYSFGKQTCRDVASGAVACTPHESLQPPELQAIWSQLETLLSFYKEPTVFEFSLFDRPVGLLNEKLIFWETRKGTK